MTKLLQHHLERVQQRMKNQADKGRTERVFEVGDKVFLKLQPYLQSSVHHRANHKLAFKFYGPFEVLERIGSVAYKLQLPPTSMIHPVIHVSQLKKLVPPDRIISKVLPQEPPEHQSPECVLARQSHNLGGTHVKEGLIRWTCMPDTLATWENLQEMKQCFPLAPAWGQGGSQEEGDVTEPPKAPKKTSSKQMEKAIEDHCTAEQREQVRRTRRTRQLNARFSGPDWTT